MDDKQPEQRNRFSEAVVLAMAPALAYYFSHSYELGYCENFGLPASLIRVELSTVIYVMGALFGLGYTILIVLNMIVSPFKFEGPHMNTPIFIFIKNNWFAFIISIVMLFVYRFNKTGWLLFAIVVFFLFWMEFLPALIFRKAAPTLGERLNKFSEEGKYAFKLFGMIGAKYGKHVLLALILIYTTNYVARSMGRAEAENTTAFLYSDVTDNMYVSRIYGDKAFMFTIDNTTNTPNKNFVVLNLNQYPKLKFTLKHTGKLNLQ